MRKIMLAIALGGAALSLGSIEASARDYAYCLTGRTVGSPGDCAYTSYEQCQASASGRGLLCTINPRVAFARQGYPVEAYDPADRYEAPRRGKRQRYYEPY